MKIPFFHFQRLQIHISSEKKIFKGITMTDELVSKYYGGPKPTKKFVESNKNLQTFGSLTDIYVPSSPYSLTDNGNYADEVKKMGKTEANTLLPKSFDRLKESGFIYYRGKLMSQYDLVEEAVKMKAIHLDDYKNATEAYRAAEKALILDKASRKYPWSNTLYSEDGMYVMKTDENGKIVGMKSALIDGVHIIDVATRMASGELNKNIETMYLNYLQDVDPELYEAATKIGREVRSFTIMFAMYEEGSISELQLKYSCTLLDYLFPSNERRSYQNTFLFFKEIKSTGNWEKLLQDYSPEGFAKVEQERQKTYKSFGGII